MVSNNNVLYTGVQFRQKVRERLWVKHWTTSAYNQKITTSSKEMKLSLLDIKIHTSMKIKTLRFLVNECLCQVSCLGKSGGFGTCQTNSLVIITPTSQRLHFSWNLVCWVGLNFLWSCSIPRKRSVQADTLFKLIFSITRILTWGWSRYEECIKYDASGFRVAFNFRVLPMRFFAINEAPSQLRAR